MQDFYPTPGTIATCMFYTGLDPYTLKEVYVPKTPEEKAEQRVLLQYFKPENQRAVERALRKAGRSDLIGTGKNCLIKPSPATLIKQAKNSDGKKHGPRSAGKNSGGKNGGRKPGNNTRGRKRK